jgi:hypothetical protein
MRVREGPHPQPLSHNVDNVAVVKTTTILRLFRLNRNWVGEGSQIVDTVPAPLSHLDGQRVDLCKRKSSSVGGTVSTKWERGGG